MCAVIPLQETQLHDVADNLRLLFEPLALALHNLPSDFGEAGDLVSDALGGDFPDLLDTTDFESWPGYSITAGAGYDLYNTELVPLANRPIQTGIVPLGGIPVLDEELRPELYAGDLDGPADVNARAIADMNARNVPTEFYSGGVAQSIASAIANVSVQSVAPTGDASDGGDAGIIPPGQSAPPPPPTTNPDDAGIIAPPGG